MRGVEPCRAFGSVSRLRRGPLRFHRDDPPASERLDRGRMVGVIGPLETPYLLEETGTLIRRFVHMSEEQLLAACLWVLFTWVTDASDVAPYLDVSSPTRECGKTRFFEVLELVCKAPRRCTGQTEATLFRMIEAEHPTLLLDEIDTTFGKDPKLYSGIRGVLDEGHRRGGKVPRMVGEGKGMKMVFFDVFGPKAFAGIGVLPETVASRSIPIRLHRKPRFAAVERFRFRRENGASAELREQLAEWAGHVRNDLADAEPSLPDELSDRQWDLWEPLFAIADMGDVGADARTAAVSLHAGAYSETSAEMLVLTHIRETFNGHERMSTADLLAALVARDDAPWPRWWAADVDAGRLKAPASKLARLLRPFDIAPTQLWIDGRKERGYEAEAFSTAWERYVPVPAPADGRTVDGSAETPSDLQLTVLPSTGGVKGRAADLAGSGSCPERGCWPHQGGHFQGCSRRSA